MKLFIHLPNFNGRTIEVWEWTKKFVPHLTGHVITYRWAWDYLSMSGLKLFPVSKKGPLKSAAVCITLQWRHSGRDGVSNHQPHHCSLNRLFRRRSKKTNKNSPHKWPVTRKMFPLDACRHDLQNIRDTLWIWVWCYWNGNHWSNIYIYTYCQKQTIVAQGYNFGPWIRFWLTSREPKMLTL